MAISNTEGGKVVIGLDFVTKGQSLGKATKQIESQLIQLQRRSASVGKQMGSIIPAFAATGAAAFSAYRFAISSAVQFEDTFAGIKKTLNFTETATVSAEKRFKNLSNEIRNIAKTTPIATNELNKIGEIGGQLGIQASNIGSFIDTISKLTVATTMGAEDAAFAISRLANITNTAEDDIDNLASVLVRLGNEFAATESEIINTSLGIATAMEAMESEFSNAAVDSLALATALKAVGVQSQSGATAVQRTLDKLSSAVAGGGRELSLFAKLAGMTTTAFRELAKVDPARAFLRFLDGIRSLGTQGADTVKILSELGLEQQRTVRALRALAFASDEVERALSTANEEFALNTALLTEAEKRFQTTTSQLGILRNNIQDIGLELGENTLPILNRVIDGFTTMSKAVENDDITDSITRLGIALGAFATGRAAFKNIAEDFSKIQGSAATGGSAFFGDIISVDSMAGPRALAQIEKNRAEYAKIIADEYSRYRIELEKTDPHQLEAFDKYIESTLEKTKTGLDFLDQKEVPFRMTNDIFTAGLQSQGFDTTQIESILNQASLEGIEVFGTKIDSENIANLTEREQRLLQIREQLTDEINSQVNVEERLNTILEKKASIEDDILDIQEGQRAGNQAFERHLEVLSDEALESTDRLTYLNTQLDELNKREKEFKDAGDVVGFEEQKVDIKERIRGEKESLKNLEDRIALLKKEKTMQDVYRERGADPELAAQSKAQLENLQRITKSQTALVDLTTGKTTPFSMFLSNVDEMLTNNIKLSEEARKSLHQYQASLREVQTKITQLDKEKSEARITAAQEEELFNLKNQREELNKNIIDTKANITVLEEYADGFSNLKTKITEFTNTTTDEMVKRANLVKQVSDTEIGKIEETIEKIEAEKKARQVRIHEIDRELKLLREENQLKSVKDIEASVDPTSEKGKELIQEFDTLKNMEERRKVLQQNNKIISSRLQALAKEEKQLKANLNTAGKRNKLEAEKNLKLKEAEKIDLLQRQREITENLEDQNNLIEAQRGKFNKAADALNLNNEKIINLEAERAKISKEIDGATEGIKQREGVIKNLKENQVDLDEEQRKLTDEINKQVRQQLSLEESKALEKARNLENELNLVNQQFEEETKLLELNDTNLEQLRNKQELLENINETLSKEVQAGDISQAQADSLIAQLNEEFAIGARGQKGEQLKPSEVLDMDVLTQKQKRFKIPKVSKATKESYSALKSEIRQVDSGLIGLGNRVRTNTKRFIPFQKQIGKIIQSFGLLRQKELRNLEIQMARNNKINGRVRNSFLRLTKVINGVGMAVKGLIANMGAMAAFMMVMSTGFKVFENLSKSESAIEGVRDALDGLFEDAQTREGLKAQQSELEKLLEEYQQKGPEFDNVVKAIETRLEDTKKSLREANNVFEEQMAEIGSTLLFDTTVDDKIGDLEKRIPAIAEFIGADAELLIDSITKSIGKSIADSTVDASPRDLLESFTDISSFNQATQDIFGALLETFEDDSNLVYDPTIPFENYFQVRQKDLIQFFREQGDLGEILGEGIIMGSDPSAQFKIADKVTNHLFGRDFNARFEDNMDSRFDNFRVEVDPAGIITLSRSSLNGFREETLATIDQEFFQKFVDGLDPEILEKRFNTRDRQRAAQQMMMTALGFASSDPEQFKREITALLVLGKNVVDQSLEKMDSGQSVIKEMQDQALMSELRQFQNQGIIDKILDPKVNRAKAEQQLAFAREVAREAEVEKAKELRDELNLADFAASKFSETMKNNLVNSAQTVMDVFGAVPTQIKKSMKKIVEELIVKQAMQKNFENMIKRLAQNAPLLAEQLSKQGVAAMQITQDFLKDRTAAFMAEGALMQTIPEFAAEIGIEEDVVDKFQNQAIEIGSSLADGILIGLHNRGAINLPQMMVNLINSAIFAGAGPDGADTGSPSRKTRDLIGVPMLEGIIAPFADKNKAAKIIAQSVGAAVTQAVKLVDGQIKYLYATYEQALSEVDEALQVLFTFTQAERDLLQAHYSVQKAEQALMATRRQQASFNDRYLEHMIELARLEQEGRKGNITGAEELDILKQKVALEDKLKRAKGEFSAQERLAIANAEEELEKLTLAAEAGIVTALEVEAAQEALDEMKGTNLSADEQRIAILELSEAEKQLQKTEDDARKIEQELLSIRETHALMLDEAANQYYELETAIDNYDAAVENVFTTELKYEQARERFKDFADGAGKEIFAQMVAGYGSMGVVLQGIINKTNTFATTTAVAMENAAESVRGYLDQLALAEQYKILDTQGTDSIGVPQAQKKYPSFKTFLQDAFGANSATYTEIMKNYGQGTLGITTAGSAGQFRDDEEMNLASIAAKRVLSQDYANTEGEQYQFIRAVEGLLGIPISLFDSGQLATSAEALAAKDLTHLVPSLLNAGVQIYDTSQKLAEAKAGDYSRNVASGTRTAGYIPSIVNTQLGPSLELFANDLQNLLNFIPRINPKTGQDQSKLKNLSDMLSYLNLEPSMYAKYMAQQQAIKQGQQLSDKETRSTYGYFDSLANKLQSVLADLGLTNYNVLRGFKYGGYMKPFQRALVGEYGPEMVTAVPGGGLRVQPEGGRGASINIDNLNVQVTGVPSDPIQARKAAQQIQRALVQLSKEGSSGTGLRRN